MAMFNLTGFQRDLLFIIAGHDQPSGQDIKDCLDADTDLDVTHGRLYPNLDTLVDNDLVEKGEIDRRTNYYDLTTDGEEMLDNRREWEDQYLNQEGTVVSATVE